jgi:precorrin-3B synthase
VPASQPLITPTPSDQTVLPKSGGAAQIAGDDGPLVKGWCPGALRPMMSGDGLVLRIRPVAGRLTQAQATGVAELALQYGNGLIDFSARANLQIRGVTPQGHPALIAALDDLGLIDPTPQAEAQRNITVWPFWTPADPTVMLSHAIAAELTGPNAPVLPSKFGVVLDLGPVPVLRAVSGDIRVERTAQGDFIVAPDGLDHGMVLEHSDLAEYVGSLARWFVYSGGITNGRGRMAALIARGVIPDLSIGTTPHQAGMQALPLQTPATINATPPPAPSVVPTGAMVGFDFGQTDAKTFGALAGLGPLRITPWRMVIIEGATQMPKMAGVITTSHDPMLKITACTGAPGCLQALQPTRALGRALGLLQPVNGPRAQGSASGGVISTRPAFSDLKMVHISGCTKGCAHPRTADVTLVGTADGFDVIRDGTAQDPPVIRGLTHRQLCDHPEVLSERP